jgi:3-isopropylmalate/(R)-2-methylmalate dehydratase large subunit
LGKTISEKILAKAAEKKEISPGEYVHFSSPRPVPIPFEFRIPPGGHLAMRGPGQFMWLSAKKLFDPNRVILIDDHPGVTATPGTEEGRSDFLKWAKDMGIPNNNIFQMGRNGIGHIVAAELCWALPGTIYLSITDGHASTLGGLGSFGLSLSYESGSYLVTGRSWLRVPETIKFNVTGKLQDGVMARDVFESVLSDIGPAGAPYQVMEWTGPVIDDMSMDGRFSLCCNALFTGAKTGIVNPDQKTIVYVKERTEEPFELLVSDPDAKYAKAYDYDVSDLEPQVVEPPKRWTVKPLKEFKDVKINRAFIGTCANGRMEDMRMAARILKGAKIHPSVRLNITPGSVRILRQCALEGLLETFIDAECEMPSPCCGMCYGQNTPLAAGDVCISTGTCNYPGRMGSREAKIYLANPATVAASAIEGRIADPRRYL